MCVFLRMKCSSGDIDPGTVAEIIDRFEVGRRLYQIEVRGGLPAALGLLKARECLVESVAAVEEDSTPTDRGVVTARVRAEHLDAAGALRAKLLRVIANRQSPETADVPGGSGPKEYTKALKPLKPRCEESLGRVRAPALGLVDASWAVGPGGCASRPARRRAPGAGTAPFSSTRPVVSMRPQSARSLCVARVSRRAPSCERPVR